MLSPSSLEYTPTTKSLLFLFALNTLSKSYVKSIYYTFATNFELLIGSVLLYNFRLMERLWGPRKFASFFLVNFISSVALSSYVHPTPISFLFATLVPFILDVPGVYPQQTPIFTINEKWTLYFIAVQLLPFNKSAAVLGFTMGIIWKFTPLNQFRIPKPIFDVLQSVFFVKPSIQTKKEPTSLETLVPTPSEEQITQLANMGFPREKVIAALKATNNNVERAAIYLLEH